MYRWDTHAQFCRLVHSVVAVGAVQRAKWRRTFGSTCNVNDRPHTWSRNNMYAKWCQSTTTLAEFLRYEKSGTIPLSLFFMSFLRGRSSGRRRWGGTLRCGGLQSTKYHEPLLIFLETNQTRYFQRRQIGHILIIDTNQSVAHQYLFV